MYPQQIAFQGLADQIAKTYRSLPSRVRQGVLAFGFLASFAAGVAVDRYAQRTSPSRDGDAAAALAPASLPLPQVESNQDSPTGAVYLVRKGDTYTAVVRSRRGILAPRDEIASINELATVNGGISGALDDYITVETSPGKVRIAYRPDGIPDGRLKPGMTLAIPASWQQSADSSALSAPVPSVPNRKPSATSALYQSQPVPQLIVLGAAVTSTAALGRGLPHKTYWQAATMPADNLAVTPAPLVPVSSESEHAALTELLAAPAAEQRPSADRASSLKQYPWNGSMAWVAGRPNRFPLVGSLDELYAKVFGRATAQRGQAWLSPYTGPRIP